MARAAPPPPDPDRGMWQGKSVAKRFVSPDGMVVLVGRSAADNDVLSLRLAAPQDFWLHVAADSGSHVVVRNPERLDRLPKETRLFAAGLAAGHSKLARGGRVAVHLCRAGEVSKPRGYPPGKVQLERYETVHAAPTRGVDVAPTSAEGREGKGSKPPGR